MPLFGRDADRIAAIVDLNYFLQWLQLDARGAGAALEQASMQIGTMDKRVGELKAFFERTAERNASDLFPGDAIANHQAGRKHGQWTHVVGDAEDGEHPEHVRPKLYSRANFLEFGSLLQNLNAEPLPRQGQRRG